MRIPRDVSGADLVRGLERVGYTVTRQTGSHIRMTCTTPNQHHVTIPNHSHLRVGTLSSVLAAVVTHLGISRDNLLKRVF